MTDSDSRPSMDVWPKAKFHFEIQWGSAMLSFAEVTGLDSESEPIDYRSVEDPVHSIFKMPELKKNGFIILKRGLYSSDKPFQNWFNTIQIDAMKRLPLTLSLCDEKGSPVMEWELVNASPTKIIGVGLESDSLSYEVPIEELEIAYEGLTINTG